MTGTRRRPTLDDVAEAVGVSRATVSNAYNRPDQLSAELREEVLRTAKRLGYPGPNPIARSLARQRTGAVAFMLASGVSAAFSDPALSITLDALATEVDREGHALVLQPGGEDGGPRADRILAAQADVAVAYCLAEGASSLDAVRQRRLPLVVIDGPIVRGSALVGIDDRGGAAAAARHLVGLGHRRFAILSAQCPEPTRELLTVTEALRTRYVNDRNRLTGYLDVLASAGIDTEHIPIWTASGRSREDSRVAGRRLLELDVRPTALLCMSDELAIAAITAARQLDLRVPEDVSIVGFDDTPQASWVEPSLTTVRQDLTRKGQQAGRLALHLMSGRRPPAPITLDVELVIRNSSGPPPRK